MIEIPISSAVEVEVLVESCRSDLTQELIVSAPETVLESRAEPGAFDRLAIECHAAELAQFSLRPSAPVTLRFWNSWVIDGVEHAWTGNAGVIIEELDAPIGCDLRQRLWCSDGLGEMDFGDLVAVITIGPASD